MDEKAEFARRLTKAMQAAGYEARGSVLEKNFNSRYWGRSITFQAAASWLKGKSIPSQEKLQVLAEWLGVEPHVLRFGGEVTRRIRQKREQWDAAINYQEREVFELFLALPAAQKKLARELIQTLALVAAPKRKVL